MPYRSRKRRRRSKAGVYVALLMVLFSLGFFLIAGMWTLQYLDKFIASDEWVEDPLRDLDQPLLYQGELQQRAAIGTGAGLMLPLSFVLERIDPKIYVDQDEIVITTKEKVVYFRTDQLTAMMNDEPLDLQFPLTNVDGHYYLPIAPLQELYGLEIRETESGAVHVWREGDVIQWGEVESDNQAPVYMRQNHHIKAPIIQALHAGESVVILSEDDGWYHVITNDGYEGYVRKSSIRLAELEQIPQLRQSEPVFVPWKPIGGKINLTWEAVYNVPPSPENIGPMPGLNVVSPTWFELHPGGDGGYYVHNKADPAYIEWAHERQYQVWGLFSNSFEPDWTSEMLSSYESRINVIRQVVHYAEMYNLQGINIDFENVYLEDKDRFTQFVRELTPFLHEQGIVVSIDVTIRGGSPMWSLFYDRKELAKVVDYMIVMTYDEHWGSSPVAGSVASLPWVEKGIADIIREDDVPASKLIVGVPFYTRIWTEEAADDGSVSVSSRAVSMQAVDNLLAERSLQPVFDEATGQHYVEYVEEDKTKKIWIEDERSMRARAELVHQYDLAGIASWNRSFAKPEIWEVIEETLSYSPRP